MTRKSEGRTRECDEEETGKVQCPSIMCLLPFFFLRSNTVLGEEENWWMRDSSV